MEKNVFDKSSRFAANMNPTGFIAWLLSLNESQFEFIGWHNTRGFVLPTHPDRTGDSVAEIAEVNVEGVHWLIPIEFQSTPDRHMRSRLLEYLAALMREVEDKENGPILFCY
jgi:hypothetical protein